MSYFPAMSLTARRAQTDDLPVLTELYTALEIEMVGLHPMWPLADGLPDPVADTLTSMLDDVDTLVVVGEIEGCVLGFLVATVDTLLPRAGGEKIGSIRMIYVDHEARMVGVGEAMRELALTELREGGVRRFDAHVLPGHRLAKNFFEAGGFSARSIIMYHEE